jgi:hypothetical protein
MGFVVHRELRRVNIKEVKAISITIIENRNAILAWLGI